MAVLSTELRSSHNLTRKLQDTVSNGKPGPTPQPKATTAAPVRPQPAVTTRAPRPPVVVTSAPLPGTNGGNDFGGIGGFGDFDGFGGFDKFFCRDSLGY
ncbi:hypothetical protein ANCDUO_17308 [Ancylostoma duodenale]|uniref:Uncharacterized protein n=1 Tax=Ancylostoma duodenale TaxID=51022 RepID=A0A0C2G118_9BILA|nr:hypothetical protein ANCDUO_17308 [Ancylostoma duodenale]